MCAIVDANMASRFFGNPVDEDLRPLWDWIYSGRGVLVVGGQLFKELDKVGDARRVLREWERTGRARTAPHDKVEQETRRLKRANKRTKLYLSDDPHVIALARVSRARLLCAADELLHTDFDNKALIDGPRGVVYQYASHVHLLSPHARWHRRCPRGVPARPSRLAAPARGA